MATISEGSVDRRRLRTALRRERDRVGLTQEQVAHEMDWSLSKIIRIETGDVGVSTNDVKALLALYRVEDQGQIRDFVELARAARAKPWWAKYHGQLDPHYLAYVSLEAGASALRMYAPMVFPGLLQAEGYARSLILGTAPDPQAAANVDLQIEVRLHRQHEVLSRSPAVDLVLDEAALSRISGSHEVTRKQLEHVIAMARAKQISVRVVPFTVETHPGSYGPFIVLEFADPDGPPALYMENPLGIQILRDGTDETERVEAYRRLFQRLEAIALNQRDSLKLIRRVANGLGRARSPRPSTPDRGARVPGSARG